MLHVHVLKGTITSLAGNFTLCLTCFGYFKYLMAVKVNSRHQAGWGFFLLCSVPPLIITIIVMQ
jgi:hypothetical protein